MTLYRPVRAVLLLAMIAAFYAAIFFVLVSKTGAPGLAGVSDVDSYFDYAAGVLGGGTAYRDVASPYPLFANLLFAAVRLVTSLFGGVNANAFIWAWAALAGVVYVMVLDTVMACASSWLAVLAWLAPPTIYFALLRYDIYPAAATLLALLAIRRDSYLAGAGWLGLAVALKGYALFLLPAYCVFIAQRRGLASAATAAAVAVAPMLLGLLGTTVLTGWQDMTAPFSFQASRPVEDESTYGALNYLLGATIVPTSPVTNWIGRGLQLGCALIAAAFAPRRFDELVDAFLFALLGFIAFLSFHSPQYMLWILPVACFSSSRVILGLALVLSWLAHLHFPLLSALTFGRLNADQLYHLNVIPVTLLHFAIMVVAAHHVLSNRRGTAKLFAT
jgi:hypothetical protein